MKLMVTGIGGVGGYVASVLCAAYSDVTLIARGARKEALQKKGLVLHSDVFGERTAFPAVTDDPSTAGIQDMIFVCVKNYSLADALTAILPCVGRHTVVVLILNGVDHGAAAKKILPKCPIVDTTIYITSAYEADFSIRQSGTFARLFIGSDDKEAAQRAYDVLNCEGLTCRLSDDITAEIWNKYITNCAYNVITSYYEGTISYVFSQPKGKEEFRTLLDEAYAVGKALGIALSPTLPEEIYDRVMRQKDKDVSSSLARDIMQGRQSELETFSGYLVKTADELHIPVPFSAHCYHTILQRLQHTAT